MATTFTFAFDFSLAQLVLAAKKSYGDGTRSDVPFKADLTAKLGRMHLDSTVAPNILSTPAPVLSGGADIGVGQVYTIPHGGTLSIDLKNITDLAERAGSSFARYKFLLFALLSAAQGGTACSGVSIGNAGTGAHQLFLGAPTGTLTLNNGQLLLFADTSAAGVVVDSTHHNVLVTCNDAVVDGSLLAAVIGGQT